MPNRLFRLYQRKRVININANIVASGLLSTAVVAGILLFMKAVIKTDWPTWGYSFFSAVLDLVLDVTMFAGLHWVANHWRPLKPTTEKEKIQLNAEAPNAVKDTVQLQIERAVISPLYYIIAVAGTEMLQQHGLRPYWAVCIAYPAGLVVTRTIHTFWGLRSGTYVDHHVRNGATGAD
ncbi:MAG: hypothetical protein AAF108_05725 [Planctomycetota bacterium]